MAPSADRGISAAERRRFKVVTTAAQAAGASAPADVPSVIRASAAADGTAGNAASEGAVSGDGEEVFLTSSASNLVAGDTNAAKDVFAKDLSSGQVSRLSVASGGLQANGASVFLGASSDGLKVLMRSAASNLVPGDKNGFEDFFLLDRATGSIVRLNVQSNGREISKADQNWGASSVSLSPDGTTVLYDRTLSGQQYAYLLTVATGAVFKIDRRPEGSTFPCSSTWRGEGGDGSGNDAAKIAAGTWFSGDSQYAFFRGCETLSDGTNGNRIYRVTVASHAVELVSTTPVPDPNWRGIDFVSSSSDGRFVAYSCQYCELAYGVPWDICVLNGPAGSSCLGTIWVRDMVSGAVIRLPREQLGPPDPRAPQWGPEIRDAQISPDGRLALVLTRDFADRNTWAVYELATGASALLFTQTDQVYGVRWSGTGSGISFVSASSTVGPGDTNTWADVFYMGTFVPPAEAFGADDYGGTIGNYTRTDTDAKVAGVGPELAVTRGYNSMDRRPAGAFGPGWSFNYDMRLNLDAVGDAYVTYPDGRVERHTKAGTAFTAPKGYASRLTAIGAGYELTQRDETRYAFDSNGRLTSIVNANGHTLTLAYASGALSKVTSASGRFLTFTWAAGRITSVTTNPIGGGLTWKYYYTSGRLTAACDPRNNAQTGECRQYTYGGGFDGQLLTRTANPDGTTIEAVTYRAGDEKMASRTDGSNATWSYAYPDPRVVVETDPRGNQVRTSYDYSYRVTKIVDAHGFVTYGYDDKGFRNEVRDANGNVVTTTHNARGDVTSNTDGAGNTAYYVYNAAGLLTHSRSRRSASASDDRYLTTYDYDTSGNKVRETSPGTSDHPNGATRRWIYTTGQEPAVGGGLMPPGLLKTEFDARDNPTSYEYDAKGDLRVVTDRAGRRTEYTYDALGRKITALEITSDHPAGLRTTFTYDELGEVTEIVAPAVTDSVTGERHQLRTVRTFNRNHQLISETRSDLLGGDLSRVTEYGYDDAGRLDLIRDPLGGELRRVYDAAGNVARVTDQAGQVYETTYDERNRPTKTVARAVTNPVTGASSDITLEERAYDPGGRLTASLDALGRTRTFAYDAADRLTKVTLVGYRDRDGMTRNIVLEEYEYDEDGHVLTEITGDGQRREERTWSEDGRVKTITVAPASLNRRTTFSYDLNGNIVREALSDGSGTEELRHTYDAADRTIRTTVENGANDLTTSFAYDQRGNLTATTDPRGTAGAADYTVEYGYDEAGNLVLERAPPTVVTTGGGATVRPTTTYGYDAYGDATTIRTPTGDVTTTTYDRLGRAQTIRHPDYTRPDGTAQSPAIESMSYSPTGNLVQWIDRRGGTWDFTFDTLNRPVRTEEPLIGTTRPTTVTAYDHASNPIEVVDPEGAIRQATYDDLNRPRTSTVILGTGAGARPLTTTLDHDDLGNLTYTEDPLGHTTRATFNAGSEMISSADGLGHLTTYGRDLRGRLTTTTDPLGHIVRNVYDQAGRRQVKQTLNPSGTVAATWQYDFDAASNQTRTTSPEGRVTSSAYNANNWLTAVTQQPGVSPVTTSYGYNANGALTSTKDGRGHITTVSYNSWGLPENIVEPATAQHPAAAERTWTRSYDSAGTVAREQQPGGTSISYEYDPLGRLTLQDGSGALAAASRTFGYDLAGRMTSFGHPDGQQNLTYDQRNLLLGATGPAGTATLTYDDAGRLINQADGNGTIAYSWNDANLLSGAEDPLTGLSTTYTYDQAQKPRTEVARAAGSLVDTRTYDYDNRGRLTSDILTDNAGATLATQTYGYDNDDLVTTATVQLPGNTASGAQAFAYDGASRLKRWTDGAGAIVDYQYDAAGNLTQAGSESFTYDERNRLVATPDGPRTYNARGDLTTQAISDGTTRTHAFDSLGQLITAGPTEYTYDALGRLASSNSTTFSYAGTNHDPILIGADAYTRTPSGRLLATRTDGSAYQVGSNRRGDVTHLVSPTGSVDGTEIYSPFGATDQATGVGASLGWQGDYTDPATGLVNMGARWYDPQTAGFVSRDTYAGAPTLPVSLNRYTYANGNPLEFIDPTGYCGFSLSGLTDCVSSAVSTVASAVSTGANYVANAITTGVSVVTGAVSRAWNAGTEALKSAAATAYRGVSQTAASTFADVKGVATTARKAGTYTASTLLGFGAAAVGKAKSCLTTSGTCRTVVTAVAVTAVAVACTACLIPMAIGAGIGGGVGALTCPPDQDRSMCALKGGLSGALAGAAGIGGAAAVGKTALTGSKLAQYTSGGALAGLADETTRQFIIGEANPTRLVAATVAGAGLGAATHGTILTAQRLATAGRTTTAPPNLQVGHTPQAATPSTSPAANAATRLNRAGRAYPEVIDPRTGSAIHFPGEGLTKVPVSQRVSWGAKERGAYIKQWYNRGYSTPGGGWSAYDVHHIRPREYGGTNDFDNLVPIPRDVHQQQFNSWWRDY